ncbi:hypothetical protein K504DRAFT_460902 [Pleomassaria siparia CBS 279.74]|uniref:Borealin N-terminal domain-containing protein n=1 Tax=Pleomassaria siparia CBS 279.74 TaxID=1314801 RepID=A0A6G1JWZ0_9PLEO|nr:hypothetical protein K504DRAFT_460902 [Pleomassaria siparia CBS 279.74]
MAPLMLSAEAKATMRANLELELKTRKEKLVSMCEAQVASLRSRLERRVNRVPLKQRKIKMGTFIELHNKAVAAETATHVPTQPKNTASAPIVRKTRTAPAAKAAPKPAPVEAPKAGPRPVSRAAAARTASPPKAAPVDTSKAASRSGRGAKRSSNEMSTDDKENTNGDLHVPKKRTKAAPVGPAPAARATRTTRAASRKVAPTAQILSPKTNNARPAPAAKTRRQR